MASLTLPIASLLGIAVAVILLERLRRRLRVRSEELSLATALARLDKKLLKEIGAMLSSAELSSLEEDVARRLAPEAELMESRAVRKTAEILKRRKLRAAYGVPSLTLLWR